MAQQNINDHPNSSGHYRSFLVGDITKKVGDITKKLKTR